MIMQYINPSKKFDNLYSFDMGRVALCVPKVELGQPIKNVDRMISLITEAKDDGAIVYVFPELSLTGYSLDDLFLQSWLYDQCDQALKTLISFSENIRGLIVIGSPILHQSRVYNVALVINQGKILGAVPKTYLPNYREFYEKRQFSSSLHLDQFQEIFLAGQKVPLSTDILFKCNHFEDIIIGIEICEDLWAAEQPSTRHALNGATCILNLSASNASLEKQRERITLASAQSSRLNSAYCYVAAGFGESTTDLAWDGHAFAIELGSTIAESKRFANQEITYADVDFERIRNERMRDTTFGDSLLNRVNTSQIMSFDFDPPNGTLMPLRHIEIMPFVPNNLTERDQNCGDAFEIQVQGLQKRLESSNLNKVVIGVSGGLDSSHALLVAAMTMDRMKLARSNILAYTLPGFATSSSTKNNAFALCESLDIPCTEISIEPSSRQTLEDIGYPQDDHEYDVTFENVQAGARTALLFRLANYNSALVLGTGDLSEIALGWCTYGVGDQMSHYNVNASMPKTMIKHTMNWVAEKNPFNASSVDVIKEIIATPISPELIPSKSDQIEQITEDIIGPYVLQDFNLFYVLRYGLRPEKICFLSHVAHLQNAMSTPEKSPEFSLDEICKWADVFCKRFFKGSQFKRSALPNGPKISSGGSLSPRGEWRMPSDF